MKNTIFLLISVCIFASCAVSNRIIEIDDQYKEIKSIKLIQNPKTISSEKIGNQSGRRYAFTSIYLFEEKQNGRPEITLDIRIISLLRPDELDSVLFFNLNNEKIRLVSEQYKYKQSNTSSNSILEMDTDGDGNSEINTTTTEDGNYQLMSRQFSIPKNLWTSIIFSQDIQLRLYIGKEGIDVKPNSNEVLKLKEFFTEAVNRLNARFPLIP